MTLTKTRTYQSIIGTNLSGLVGTNATPLSLLVKHAPLSFQDTLLRTRTEFALTARVGTSSPPPELGWTAAGVFLIAYWSPTGSLVAGAASGGSEHYLGSQQLSPSYAPSATAPGEYNITWKQNEPFVTETSRQSPTATVQPTFILGLVLYDPFNFFDGTFPGEATDYFGRVFTLWGTPA